METEELNTPGIEIKLIDDCIGLRSRNKIYIHKNLYKYPKLYSKVIEHEMHHGTKACYSWKDIKMDIVAIKWYICKDLLKFIWNNPRCLKQMLPLQRVDNLWLFDLEIMLIAMTAAGFCWFSRGWLW